MLLNIANSRDNRLVSQVSWQMFHSNILPQFTCDVMLKLDILEALFRCCFSLFFNKICIHLEHYIFYFLFVNVNVSFGIVTTVICFLMLFPFTKHYEYNVTRILIYI